MKKTLVSALTTALVVGAASTTFAAANPFEDVPADHWAYDAIAQLAADGVIEGYGDGTYRGDQEITRYEMAQMVARAMAKGGGDKALIDKLAAEFADELNSLGVRVAALEKKVDNVKWQGEIKYRYINERRHQNPLDVLGKNAPIQRNAQYVTLRLEPEMRINKNWTGHARLDYSTDMNSAKNASNGTIAEDEDDEFKLDRVWVQGDYKNFQIMLGKLPYVTFVDNGMIYDERVSGGQITFGSKIKVTLTGGRANVLLDDPAADPDAVPAIPARWSTTASYAGIEIYNDREDKFTWGAGYHYVGNGEFFKRFQGRNWEGGSTSASIIYLGLVWKFMDNVALHGAYAWTTSMDSDALNFGGTGGQGNKARDAWYVQVDYKGADPADKGSWGAYAAYRQLGWGVAFAPTYDAMKANEQGVELGLSFVPMKNFQANFQYFMGKNMIVQNGADDKASRFFTELNFYF